MKMFEHAMELKKISEQYYRNLSNKCASNQGIHNILNKLADDEMRHFSLFQNMKNDVDLSVGNNSIMLEIDKEIKDLKKKEHEFSCFIDQIDLYKEALELEKKHLSYYKNTLLMNKFGFTSIINEIICEEEQHISTLEYLIELINHPNTWIEQAEFNHKDEY